MKTIFIDEEYMCHLQNNGTYRMVETNAFNHVINDAIPYYRFVPKGSSYKGNVCADDFIQCVDSAEVARIQKEYEIIREHKRQALIDAGVIYPTDVLNA